MAHIGPVESVCRTGYPLDGQGDAHWNLHSYKAGVSKILTLPSVTLMILQCVSLKIIWFPSSLVLKDIIQHIEALASHTQQGLNDTSTGLSLS